jgi:hypothetical protein
VVTGIVSMAHVSATFHGSGPIADRLVQTIVATQSQRFMEPASKALASAWMVGRAFPVTC